MKELKKYRDGKITIIPLYIHLFENTADVVIWKYSMPLYY
jgi:hypothetical protein